MSIILAIESSTEVASVALQVGDVACSGNLAGRRLASRQVAGVQSHSHAVLPMVQAVLAEAGIALRQCNAIAFGAGPGSFTGVRTACGIAQGLAYGCDLPVVPVDTLVAAAQACRDATGATDILVAIDARMGEVYWGQYRWETDAGPCVGSGHWRMVIAPRVGPPGSVAPTGTVTACGNGFAVHADGFAGRSFAADALAGCMPHALQVAALAEQLLAGGHAVAARDARPVYLRNDVALTTAERAGKAGQAGRAAFGPEVPA